jgi:carbamoyltransferase
MSKIVVGLGGLLSDPACCIVKDGSLVAAVEQAKVSRQARPGSFPDEALAIALEVGQVRPAAISCVALARPFAHGSESDSQIEMRARFPEAEIVVVEHHHAHAASAYYVSGFDSASVLSVDRAGDFRSAVLFSAQHNNLTPIRELYFPDSIGDLYNRVTELLGYEARADEHKVQWMSSSGEPVYREVFRRILHRVDDTWPHTDRSYFDSDRLAQGGFSARFYTETSLPAKEKLSQTEKSNVAASLQWAVQDTISAMLGSAKTICIAGGLAMNALLVQSLESRFDRIFVQPVAGNAGTALGAALHAWHNFLGEEKRVPFTTLCLGPAYSAPQIKPVLENCKLRFRYLLTEGELIQQAIESLGDNKIVAWMQGRMEFGPRALGNRSILASPLNPYSTENLNVFIKHREKFRKFAASVPEERAAEFFTVGPNAKYLATAGRVKPAHLKTFQAALLNEDIIRVHAVNKDENPLYHALLTETGEKTGLPVLYNTSFNLFGDPLVCTPRDAVRSFYSSGIDALFAGNFYLEK